MVNTTGAGAGTNTRNGGVALTTATAANITGVGLTPGTWDCRGDVYRVAQATSSFTKFSGGLTFANATVAVPSQGLDASTYFNTAANVTGAGAIDSKVGPANFQINITSPGVTPLFLIAQDAWTVSWNSASGQVECRRQQ